MPRLLFEKTGNAIWISHLDLMRVFQRSFKRAGLPLTHSGGFNPRPSVSIALPLSVGVESACELLDFDLEGCEVSCEEIRDSLNEMLVSGVKVLEVYEEARKLKHLAYLDCVVTLEYDNGAPGADAVAELFRRETLFVEKKTKSNGIQDQDILPMIRSLNVEQTDSQTLTISARVCCQNPTLNPMQMVAAIERHAPELKPDFAKCRRVEVYDTENNIFR